MADAAYTFHSNSGPDGHDLLAWESRYVGNIRAINAGLLDAYLLKSLDGVAKTPVGEQAVLVKCGKNRQKICFFLKGPDDTVDLGRFSTRDPWATALVKELEERGHLHTVNVPQGENSLISSFESMWVGVSGTNPAGGSRVMAKGPMRQFIQIARASRASLENETLVNMFAELTTRGGTPYPLIFDKVVRCLGWLHDTSIYNTASPASASASVAAAGAKSGSRVRSNGGRSDAAERQGRTALDDAQKGGASGGGGSGGVSPEFQHNGKYPVINHEFESTTVPSLYFAGTLAHGKDFKKSAGGFIHGFRYTTRHLFRVLEAKYHRDGAWPGTVTIKGVDRWSGEVGRGRVGCNAGDFIDSPDNCAEGEFVRWTAHASMLGPTLSFIAALELLQLLHLLLHAAFVAPTV